MLTICVLPLGLLLGTGSQRPARSITTMGLHELSATTMAGEELAMSSLKGKRVVAVNVASK